MAIIIPEGRDDDIITLYKKTRNASFVGRYFRMTRERVRQILEENGVPTPRKGKVDKLGVKDLTRI